MAARRRRNYRSVDPRETEREIESVIDRVGLPDMISIMADVCVAKADHIDTNWQDRALARVWDRASKALDKLSATRAIKDTILGYGS